MLFLERVRVDGLRGLRVPSWLYFGLIDAIVFNVKEEEVNTGKKRIDEWLWEF